MAHVTTGALRRLGAETFGHRLRRARWESGVNLREAAELISREAMFVSHTSLARLEDFDEPPAHGRRRQLACLTVLVYGYEPADFALDLAELPGSLDTGRFLALAAKLRHPKHDPDAHSQQPKGGSRWNPLSAGEAHAA